MLTISPVRSAAHATAYFVEHVDDYYIPATAQYESEWFGDLAQDLGLRGVVDRADFEDLLNGIITSEATVGQTVIDADGTQKLRHRPGYDVTFSAPKSISVLALVYGNDAVAQAHRAAVLCALAYLQEQTTTRTRCGASLNHVRTGRFASALFTHQTSRDLDPQFHTHCVIFNVTNFRGENPRSLESREFFRQQKAADAIYQAALGARLRSLGYDVCVEGEHDAPHVEIASVPHEVRDVFSKRRKSIVDALAQQGVTIQNASAQQKQVANLQTRKAKIEVSPAKLRTIWQSELHAASLEFHETSCAMRSAVPAEARQHTASVDVAVDTLFEREACVLQKDLVRRSCIEAMKHGVHPEKVLNEIHERERTGQLLQREWHGQKAWTTPDVVAVERQVLAFESAGRGQLAPVEDVPTAELAIQECAANSDQEWTAEQRRAAIGIMTSGNQIAGLQGLAGTAKTSSVLKFIASRFGDRGVQVVGLAPTHSAVRELQNGAGLDRAETVAGFLARAKESPATARCFIVDEASLLSTADLAGLMSRVGPSDRMLLVGDRQQIGSVSAGRSFAQLQDAGMQTFRLTKILRQRQESLREAVDHAARGLASQAVRMLVKEECVAEDESEERRFGAIAGTYLELSATQRQGCLLIEPSRRGRSLINEMVLTKLLERGELSDARQLVMRESVDWTAREKCSTSSYGTGMIVSFSKPQTNCQLRPLSEYKVTDVSLARKEILLRASNGVETWWSPEGTDASQIRVARTVPMTLAKGCRLQITANHRMHRLVNGDLVTLEDSSEAGDRLLIKTVDQRRIWLDLANPFNRYLRLGYAVTAHAAQGKTVDRVIAHLPSKSSLSSQRTAYVCLSRAREEAKIVTDSVEKLASSLKSNSGEKSQGLTQIESESSVTDQGQRTRLERFIDGLEKELNSSVHEEYRI